MAEHVIRELSPHCENNMQRKVGKLNFFIKFRKQIDAYCEFEK